MLDTAAHLLDRVIPHIPVRQYVFTFSGRVRWHLAQDPKLAAKALEVCMRVIFAWQRRAGRNQGVVFRAPKRSQSARPDCGTYVDRAKRQLIIPIDSDRGGITSPSGIQGPAAPGFVPQLANRDDRLLLNATLRL